MGVSEIKLVSVRLARIQFKVFCSLEAAVETLETAFASFAAEPAAAHGGNTENLC